MPDYKAFVHYGSWDDETRAFPAMKWMENYTKKAIDQREFANGVSAAEYHTEDWVFQKSDGTRVKGADNAWKALAEVYGPFAAHKHDPEFLVTWETEKGWTMIGEATLYFKVHAPLSETVTDPQGERWHGSAAGAFYFDYEKVGGSIKLSTSKIFSDPSPAMKLMLKNNMINGEQLAGIVIGS